MRGVEIKLLKLLKCIFPSECLSREPVWCGLLGHFYPKCCIHRNLCFCWVSYSLFINQSSVDLVPSIYLTPGCEMHVKIGGACAILGCTCTNIFTFLPQIVMRHN